MDGQTEREADRETDARTPSPSPAETGRGRRLGLHAQPNQHRCQQQQVLRHSDAPDGQHVLRVESVGKGGRGWSTQPEGALLERGASGRSVLQEIQGQDEECVGGERELCAGPGQVYTAGDG